MSAGPARRSGPGGPWARRRPSGCWGRAGRARRSRASAPHHRAAGTATS